MAYPDIDKPSDYFETKLYTGNGGTQSITGLDFEPNWTWIKHRDGATAHMIFDSVRGALYRLQSNSSNSETSAANTLTSWNSDGFALGSENDTNGNSRLFVSWNWKAGTSVSGNTGGSGTSKSYSGSVNTDAGFSIIKYTGNGTAGHTIPHHLGVQPQLVICKRLGQYGQWVVGSMALPNQFEQFLELDLTGAAQTSSLRWNNTDPSSSVFTVGSTADTNQDGTTIIAYSFAEKKGYSKFSSYTGTSSQIFNYTGFKPRFILIKKTSEGASWQLFDTKRTSSNGGNVLNYIIYPNLSNSEDDDAYNYIDAYANGFRCFSGPGGQGTETNKNGQNFIYMAFAENPFVTSTGNGSIPTTAR